MQDVKQSNFGLCDHEKETLRLIDVLLASGLSVKQITQLLKKKKTTQ